MKNYFKHALALLIVFSAAMTHASDSSSLTAICRVWVEEDATAYHVIFNAQQKQNVGIKILDAMDALVYEESMKTQSFNKKYDMSHLPKGTYKIMVSSEGEQITKTIEVGNLQGFNFMMAPAQGKSVSLIGSQANGKSLTVAIYDQDDEQVFRESYSDTRQLNKRFNFEGMDCSQITVKLLHGGQVVQEKKFEL